MCLVPDDIVIYFVEFVCLPNAVVDFSFDDTEDYRDAIFPLLLTESFVFLDTFGVDIPMFKSGVTVQWSSSGYYNNYGSC